MGIDRPAERGYFCKAKIGSRRTTSPPRNAEGADKDTDKAMGHKVQAISYKGILYETFGT
ncbi:MAG: hypothetical protein IJ014_06010 [Rikenellaceae bacterium]|nr:hypothetical protein [Rikenellaceae bacterium]